MIGITSQTVPVTGSLGSPGLDSYLRWGIPGEDGITALGVGANISASISQTGEVPLTIYFSEDSDPDNAIQTSAQILLYYANAVTGKAEDLYPFKANWQMSETDSYELIADKTIDALIEMSDNSTPLELRGINESSIRGSKASIVAALSGAATSAWNENIIGKTVDEEPVGNASSSGIIQSLYHAIDVQATIKADWETIIRDGDYTDITIPWSIGLEYELWGGRIEL